MISFLKYIFIAMLTCLSGCKVKSEITYTLTFLSHFNNLLALILLFCVQTISLDSSFQYLSV